MTEGTKHVPASRLVIAYAFAPYADTSAVVAAKRVRAHGEPVDVIQNRMDELRPTDQSLEEICQDLIRRRQVLGTRTRFGAWSAIREFSDAGLRTIRTWEADQGPYASVYSRAHFIASHFLAARFKLHRPDVVWEAEFSDPLSRNAVGKMRDSVVEDDILLAELRAGLTAAGNTPPDTDNVYVWGEYAALALADELVFTNEAQRDYVLGLYDPRDPVVGRARQRATIAAHPTPPPELYRAATAAYRMPSEAVNIGYFGNIYASQQPEAVLGAFADMPVSDRQKVHLHVFTAATDEFGELVHAAGVQDTVSIARRLPYLEFLNMATRMDVLLAIDAKSPPGRHRNPVLLSKWSDYRGAGTPVWGVVEEGSALDRQDLAYRSPLGHRTAALQVLVSLSRSESFPPTPAATPES